jgi:hypothetical protein
MEDNGGGRNTTQKHMLTIILIVTASLAWVADNKETG